MSKRNDLWDDLEKRRLSFMRDSNFCQVEIKTKIYELIYPGRQSHFKRQSPSQIQDCLKIIEKDNRSACPVDQSRAMSKQHLIKMHSVSVFDLRKWPLTCGMR